MKEKTVKIGIIGTGGRGIFCFGVLLSKAQNVKIAALCDVNKVRMEEATKRLTGKQNLYENTSDMFNNENLDAVIVTTPDYLHEEHAVAALENGVNVLIDKPLATSVKGSKEILRAAEKAGKTVMLGFNLRHDPTLKRLKQIITDGALGNVFLIENREFYDGGKTYMSRWNRKREWSGGLWIHKGSHDFDVFQWLLDFPKPVKVSSTAGINVLNREGIPFELEKGIEVGPTCHECAYNKICPDVNIYNSDEHPEWGEDARKIDNYAVDLCMYISDKDVHDNGIAIVDYDNGVRASHMECFVCSISDRMYTVVGDKGLAEVSLRNRIITVRPRWSQEVITYNIPDVAGGHGGADPQLVKAFLNVIRGNHGNTSTAEHGMWSTAVGEAAEISARENRMVWIEELMK